VWGEGDHQTAVGFIIAVETALPAKPVLPLQLFWTIVYIPFSGVIPPCK